MGKRFIFKILVVSGLLASAAAAPALADTYTNLSVSNANDGFGSSYTLTATCDLNTNVCGSVTLAINTTGANYGYISDVAFKIGTTDTLTGTLSAPTSGWLTTTSSLSNSGCSGTNSDGQLCSYATGNFAATGGTLTWTWTNVAISGPISIAHVGYKYDRTTTLGNGLIVSVDYGTTSAPEPSSVSMLGLGLAGLIGLAFARRRATLS